MDFLKNRIEILKDQVEQLQKYHQIDSHHFESFLRKLSKEAKSLDQTTSNEIIKANLNKLKDFKPYNRRTFFERIHIRYLYEREFFNYDIKWKEQGWILNDLKTIELKLRGIILQIEEKL